MKALTIHQPWATLIMLGLKPVENRSCRYKHRGPLLIHAGRSTEFMSVIHDPAFRNYAALLSAQPPLPFGCILGQVTVIDCLSAEEYRYHFGDDQWVAGPFCLVLENPIRLAHPIAYRGQQGLFTIDDQKYARLIDDQFCRCSGLPTSEELAHEK